MHTRGGFLYAFATALLLTAWSQGAPAFDPVGGMASLYSAQVDRKLTVPPAEARRYARLAEESLARAEVALVQPQYLVVVDRDPNVQALFLLFRDGQGQSQLVGASPVSTGRAGSFDEFETPAGVFDHSVEHPDFRSAGTPDVEGLRGYGAKGLRVFDFGWQQVPRTSGRATTQIRLQMHATDPDLLERRLGTAQSKGCILIPATLNRLIDRYGLLDAAYLRPGGDDEALAVLDPQRSPVGYPGRYLIVVDTRRSERPDWSPRPYIPHRKPPAAAKR